MKREFSVCALVAVVLAFAAAAVPGPIQSQKPLPPAQTPFAKTLPPQAHFPQHRNFPILSDLPVPKIFPDLIPLTPIERLGKQLVFDTVLSDPFPATQPSASQQQQGKFFIPIRPGERILTDIRHLPLDTPLMESCATCHAIRSGQSGPSSENNIEFGGILPGAPLGTFGSVKAPHLGYRLAFAPQGPFTFVDDEGEEELVFGIFGNKRGRDGIDVGASTNPVEMGNKSTESVSNSGHGKLRQGFSKLIARKIPFRPYANLWKQVFGVNDFTFNPAQVSPSDPSFINVVSGEERIFTHFLEACQAYCCSPEVVSFSTKDDAEDEGLYEFTPSEQRGKDLFNGKAQCSKCHSDTEITIPFAQRGRQTKHSDIYTNFSAANTGVPKSFRNPSLRNNPAFIDIGVQGDPFPSQDGTDLTDPKFRGTFNIPSLRDFARVPNAQFVKSAFHNGALVGTIDDLLEQVFDFYDLRNVAESDKCGPTGLRARVVVDLRDGPPKGFHMLFPPPETLGDNVVNVAGNSPSNAGSDLAHDGRVGNLGLTRKEKKDGAAFVKCLVDGFMAPQAP